MTKLGGVFSVGVLKSYIMSVTQHQDKGMLICLLFRTFSCPARSSHAT